MKLNLKEMLNEKLRESEAVKGLVEVIRRQFRNVLLEAGSVSVYRLRKEEQQGEMKIYRSWWWKKSLDEEAE